MKRLLGIGFLLMLAPWVLLAKNKPSTTEKPNVVLILIDDLSHYGVTAYGANKVGSLRGDFKAETIATPNIDKLAETGLMCSNAFAYPLCEPTRIALMSGKYNQRNFLRCKSQHSSDVTFGDVFQQQGYATGIFGKWKQTRGTKEIHGKDYIYEFGWDEFCAFDVVTEGKRFINPNLIINGEYYDYQMRTDLDPVTGRRWYGPDICNRYALDFIEKNKEKPFFLYYPMLLVHDEHQPTPDTRPKKLFDEFDEGRNAHNPKKGDDRKYFPDMISYMDKLIGNVVTKLDELQLRENTLIVVMGDNGTKECFTHILPNDSIYPGRKGGNTDNGLHVPLVLNQLGKIKAGNHTIRKYDGMVDVTDIYPTIAEATSVEIPKSNELDGISFWPQVMGKKGEARDVIYTWYNNNQPYTSDKELLIYAFNKEFKRYAPCTEYPEGRFFDLRTDPLEKAGDTVVERRFKVMLHSGLDIARLTKEQQKAYHELGKIIDSYKEEDVQSLKIDAPKSALTIGESYQLSCAVKPTNATKRNIIWESSNNAVVAIDKFGNLKALGKGKATISVYSWSDAYPVAANVKQTFSKSGISHSIEVIVN
ncbi:sulfatase-like hydrolase/transferase [Labilibacter marinus]|uniref:sulfatase-like hydrolase/transferase n=1 Tax=Labilibacter marinus TaxID=1477105 RepID=UPI00082F114B|nr:sulfatase-like hydrolase/transferase [Labilibacter marinus]